MAYDGTMKRLCLLCALMAAPASADSDVDQGLDLLQQGSRLLMQGLMEQIEPELKALAEEMGPKLLELQGMIGDLTQYHAPEVLPNGDIILRRKQPLVPVVPQGDIEL
jgi:hypothetical protein